jgi:hypothetical protein
VSGQHSFVQEFRRKLESVADDVAEGFEGLAKALDEELQKRKSDHPPTEDAAPESKPESKPEEP